MCSFVLFTNSFHIFECNNKNVNFPENTVVYTIHIQAFKLSLLLGLQRWKEYKNILLK